jgi:hypothetical protein
MSIDRIALLKALHLFGMAAAWSEWLSQYGHQQQPVMPEVWLDRLTDLPPSISLNPLIMHLMMPKTPGYVVM